MLILWGVRRGRSIYTGFYARGVHHVPKILVMDQSNAPFERNINN
jgi:hypothetical protein